MNMTLFSVIQKLVAEQGEAVLADARRVRAYLADFAAKEPKAQRAVFVRCLEQGYYAQLKNCAKPERVIIKSRMASRMHEDENLYERWRIVEYNKKVLY